MSIKKKVLLLLIFSSVITFGILGAVFYNSLTALQNRVIQISDKEITQYKKDRLKRAVENEVVLLQAMYRKYMPQAEKEAVYELVKDIVKNSKYDEGIYFFAYKYDGTKVAWPQNPIEEETANMMNWKDLDGTFVIKEFNNAAKKNGGFVTYSVPGKDSGEKEQMVTYVKPLPEVDIYIGAEMYASSLEKEANITKLVMKGEEQKVTFNMIYGTLIILLFIIISYTLLFRRFTINVNTIKEFLERMKSGDMSHRVDIKSKDEMEEIGRYLNEAGIILEKVSSEMKREANLFDDSIKEVKKGNEALMKQGVMQSGELNEALKSAEKAEFIIDNSILKSGEAKNISMDAKEKFEAILKTSEALIQAIYVIIESYKKVEGASLIVEDVAFHTNILSLNAAVEAAKAGTGGKGFAVVAVEMKHLATACRKSSYDVKHLMSETFGKIDEGKKMAEGTIENIRKILEETASIYETMVNVNSFANEEKKVIETVNSSLIRLNDSLYKGMEIAEVAVSNAQVLQERGTEVSKHLEFFRSETEDDILFGHMEKLIGDDLEEKK